ncbi:MAG: ACT domain-containing protein [Anaerolineae bacterium]|nr:ACT domain-containing protein [Anaerolineae bacterium]
MTPFSALIVDKDEITLWVTTDLWESAKPIATAVEVSPPYRLITFDITLDLTLVGYMAAITSVLTEAGISLMTVSAFSRDHVLVAENNFERAWNALSVWIQQYRAQEIKSQKQVVQD